jgi:hypothetical protein
MFKSENKASHCTVKYLTTMTAEDKLQDQTNLEAEIGRLLTEEECKMRYQKIPVAQNAKLRKGV